MIRVTQLQFVWLAAPLEQRQQFLSTNFIVAETHALTLARHGRADGMRVLRDIDASSIIIERVTERDETAARGIIYQYDDKDFSLTDAISFAVMRRLGIGTAFTFDRDFAQFGFATVP